MILAGFARLYQTGRLCIRGGEGRLENARREERRALSSKAHGTGGRDGERKVEANRSWDP